MRLSRLIAPALLAAIVVSIAGQAQTTFEAVCGRGFHDLALLKQKQETILIKRIEYKDGSVWMRQ